MPIARYIALVVVLLLLYLVTSSYLTAYVKFQLSSCIDLFVAS